MSGTVTLGLTEAMVLGALRTVLTGIMPAGIEILRSEVNRVAEPIGPDFIMLTPILRSRLAMTVSAYTDGFFVTPPVPGTRQDMQPTQVTVQLDIHGPNSADNTQVITTLFRCDVATAAFDAQALGVQALYAGEPRQSPFINGEQQIEYRWTVDLLLQANAAVTSPQQFAGTLTPTLNEFA